MYAYLYVSYRALYILLIGVNSMAELVHYWIYWFKRGQNFNSLKAIRKIIGVKMLNWKYFLNVRINTSPKSPKKISTNWGKIGHFLTTSRNEPWNFPFLFFNTLLVRISIIQDLGISFPAEAAVAAVAATNSSYATFKVQINLSRSSLNITSYSLS